MSLVFKIMKAAASFHGVAYNEKKQKQGTASLIHFENFGHLHLGKEKISKDEFKKYLEQHSKRNERIKKSQFHAILSCKGNLYTHETLKEHALQVMKRLGYEGNPLLIYEHRDTNNNHIHIVTSRVDPKGKKINHDFEGKRANQIINELLSLDTKQEYSKHIAAVLQYNFSTIAQGVLLMENMGYDVKVKDTEIFFYKHGMEQGVIDKNEFKNKTETEVLNKPSPAFIRALIYKYQKEYSPVLAFKNMPVYSTEKKKFESDLTSFLKSRFGLEFVFFTGKEKEKPYGYTCIDHNNKAVYKGSEIMKMERLINPLPTAAYAEQNKAGSDNETKMNANYTTADVTNTYNNSNNAPQPNFAIDDIIADIQRQIEQDMHQVAGKKRKGKKRDFI
jgi:Relaxase/Mobilisation nuclease domain